MPSRRSWTALLAALLLLVPLALRAHGHAPHAGSDCAVCVVSHHAPAAHATAPAVAAPVAVVSKIEIAVVADPTCAERTVHAGRGPPLLLRTLLS
jgi:hypothetical protein